MKASTLFLLILIIYLQVPAQNVGIGITNPVTKLDVMGSFKVSTDYESGKPSEKLETSLIKKRKIRR